LTLRSVNLFMGSYHRDKKSCQGVFVRFFRIRFNEVMTIYYYC
jgi:hypothetical protein